MNMKRLLLAVLLLLSLPAAAKRYDASIIGPMDGENLAAAYSDLMNAPGPEVSLRIFSPGGSLTMTLLFIDLVKDWEQATGKHLTCVATSIAASAAVILLESEACQVRVAEPATALMWHEGYLSGRDGPLKQDEQDYINTLNMVVAELIAPRMGMTPVAYLAWIAGGKERWLTAREALEAGFLDRIEVWSGQAPESEPIPEL